MPLLGLPAILPGRALGRDAVEAGEGGRRRGGVSSPSRRAFDRASLVAGTPVDAGLEHAEIDAVERNLARLSIEEPRAVADAVSPSLREEVREHRVSA